MKIAIVHDWLTSYAGAEKVLEEMLECYPAADLFTVVDFLSCEQRQRLKGKRSTTTFIQKMPFSKNKYRSYLPLMPLAIEQLDLSSYDLIISSSHAVAKGVLTGPNQLHLSYVHSPMRYAWDLQHQHLKESGMNKGVKSYLARYLLHKMRIWDLRTANGVDKFIANSKFIAKRIWKVYRRESEVIYPPVDTNYFQLGGKKENFYLTVSRMVPYKRMDLIVAAFSKMPDRKLIVIGDGPDMDKIKKVSASNVQILGRQSSEIVRDHLQRAKAFVFAAEEDFGIIPVEAQSCGTPVIAFGKGGALETVKDIRHKNPTGVFFMKQEILDIQNAVSFFESNIDIFKPAQCRANALNFSSEVFREKLKMFVDDEWCKFNI